MACFTARGGVLAFAKRVWHCSAGFENTDDILRKRYASSQNGQRSFRKGGGKAFSSNSSFTAIEFRTYVCTTGAAFGLLTPWSVPRSQSTVLHSRLNRQLPDQRNGEPGTPEAPPLLGMCYFADGPVLGTCHNEPLSSTPHLEIPQHSERH